MEPGKTFEDRIAGRMATKAAEREKVTQYVNTKLAGVYCSICNKSKWAIIDGVYKLVDESGASGSVFDMMSSSIPVVCCVCENCGNIVMLSAQVIRNWGSNEKEQSKEA